MQLTIQDRWPDKVERSESGCLVWTGARTGSYGSVRVDGIVKRAHRAAWEFVHGPIPTGRVVDHVCHNKLCVDTEHLRLATLAENARNRGGSRKGSTSGVRGVSWNRDTRRWRAAVWIDGRNVHLGYFDTKDAAGRAATLKRANAFGDFAGASS